MNGQPPELTIKEFRDSLRFYIPNRLMAAERWLNQYDKSISEQTRTEVRQLYEFIKRHIEIALKPGFSQEDPTNACACVTLLLYTLRLDSLLFKEPISDDIKQSVMNHIKFFLNKYILDKEGKIAEETNRWFYWLNEEITQYWHLPMENEFK